MPPSPCFMGLPIEVRMEIYRCYFHLEGGLSHSHRCQKLIATDRSEKLQTSLMYTCRAVAAETKGLLLQFNTITFTTGCHIKKYHLANDFSQTLSQLSYQRFKVLTYMRPAISEQIYDEITTQFPLFKPVLDAIREHRPVGEWDDNGFISRVCQSGDVPSIAREATAATCRLALQSMEREAIAAVARYRQNRPQLPYHDDPLSILTLDQPAWAIPSARKLKQLQDGLYEPPEGISAWAQDNTHDHGQGIKNSTPYHFSAAATAIQFLLNLPVKQRLHLRNIVLREDTKSVAFPACHARGLIPFCQQNTRLRIERRVSLFGNVLQIPTGFFDEYMHIPDLSKALAVWIVEAMALPQAGMPPNSFRFVLDGDPALDNARIMFDKLFRKSLALHLRLEDVYKERSESPEETNNDEYTDRHAAAYPRSEALERHFQKTNNGQYILNGFPQAMEELFRNNGILRCNFTPGELGEDGKIPHYQLRFSGPDTDEDGVEILGFDPRRVVNPARDISKNMFGYTEFPGMAYW